MVCVCVIYYDIPAAELSGMIHVVCVWPICRTVWSCLLVCMYYMPTELSGGCVCIIL